jgi:hypothetical protein
MTTTFIGAVSISGYDRIVQIEGTIKYPYLIGKVAVGKFVGTVCLFASLWLTVRVSKLLTRQKLRNEGMEGKLHLNL